MTKIGYISASVSGLLVLLPSSGKGRGLWLWLVYAESISRNTYFSVKRKLFRRLFRPSEVAPKVSELDLASELWTRFSVVVFSTGIEILVLYDIFKQYLKLTAITFRFSVAINHYGDKMTSFEQSQEIRDFPDVWFLGLEAKKIEGVPGAPQNNGTSFVIVKLELKLTVKSIKPWTPGKFQNFDELQPNWLETPVSHYKSPERIFELSELWLPVFNRCC